MIEFRQRSIYLFVLKPEQILYTESILDQHHQNKLTQSRLLSTNDVNDYYLNDLSQ